MNRSIIDMPLYLGRNMACDWQVDWREQTGLSDIGGGEQITVTSIPRIIGNAQVILPESLIGAWRALVAQLQGRVNCFRWRMVDPMSGFDGGPSTWEERAKPTWTEPRPRARARAAASAGATTVLVDETALSTPIVAGQWMSWNDWPFLVVDRAGTGATVTLTVTMLRTNIPINAQMDCIARGLFVLADAGQGWPGYGPDGVGRPQAQLQEWVTNR